MSNEILQNKSRTGNFTSSQMSRLVGIGTRQMTELELKTHKEKNPKSRARTIAHKDTPDSKFYTYVDQKRREKRAKRSIQMGGGSRDTAWGNLVEKFVFEKLGLEYKMRSDETFRHQSINGWTGSPDVFIESKKVSDIKCFAPDNGSKLAECIEECHKLKSYAPLKENYEDIYWQLVSNACILGIDVAEIILYMPYMSELPAIRESAENYDGLDQYKYRFIAEIEWYELPVLPNDSGYKNLNVFEFEVPQEDKDFLTERVLLAIELRDKK